VHQSCIKICTISKQTESSCHCVPYGHRLWQGPRSWLCCCGALASSCHKYAPLFLAPVSALDSRSRPRTRPLLSFLLGHHPSHALPSSEPHPLLSPFPHSSSHRYRTWPTLSPTCDPLVIPSTSPPLPVRCTTTSVHQALLCHLACLSSIPPQIQSRARRIGLGAQVGEAWEAIRKEVVGGRATRSNHCSQI
jgi:hypothetical protein